MGPIEVQLLRTAEEAVANLLARVLTVPQVYFSAAWPDLQDNIDIVAIDRAGAGDVHVVEVKNRFDKVTTPVIRRLLAVPTHYRWVAVPTDKVHESILHSLVTKLSKHRVGLIAIVGMSNGESVANILSRAGRAEPFDRTIVGDFLARTVPDIEYGNAPRSTAHDLGPLSKQKIKRYLEEANHLAHDGHERAGFLLAWSASEAAMKLRFDGAAQSQMISPAILVRAVHESGILRSSEVEAIEKSLIIRNELVHGLEDPQGLGEACRTLTMIGNKLLKSK